VALDAGGGVVDGGVAVVHVSMEVSCGGKVDGGRGRVLCVAVTERKGVDAMCVAVYRRRK